MQSHCTTLNIILQFLLHFVNIQEHINKYTHMQVFKVFYCMINKCEFCLKKAMRIGGGGSVLKLRAPETLPLQSRRILTPSASLLSETFCPLSCSAHLE